MTVNQQKKMTHWAVRVESKLAIRSHPTSGQDEVILSDQEQKSTLFPSNYSWSLFHCCSNRMELQFYLWSGENKCSIGQNTKQQITNC